MFSASPLDSCSRTLLACNGGLSREIKKQFEVSTGEVLQVGPVAASRASSGHSCPRNVCLGAQQILSVSGCQSNTKPRRTNYQVMGGNTD